MAPTTKGRSRKTIVDIADAAGVSRSTVSLVLRASPLVREETRARVEKTINTLGYVYNRGAANLRRARSNIVGLVINDLSNPFYAELAIGMERTLQDAGYISFVANSAESVPRQTELVRSMREHGASGIILAPALDSSTATINALLWPPIPLILAIRRVIGARASLVASDNMAGAGLATGHLIGLGHRRLGFLGGMENMVVRQDRLAGFADAARGAGIAIDPADVVETMPTKQGGFEGMTALLGRRKRPSAIVCFNDVVAIGAMLAVTRRGLVTGRDVAITGFDDTAESRYVSPPLTTVAVDAGGLGQRAAQMLLRHIADGEYRIESYVGEARLVVRESCGAGLKETPR